MAEFPTRSGLSREREGKKVFVFFRNWYTKRACLLFIPSMVSWHRFLWHCIFRRKKNDQSFTESIWKIEQFLQFLINFFLGFLRAVSVIPRTAKMKVKTFYIWREFAVRMVYRIDACLFYRHIGCVGRIEISPRNCHQRKQGHWTLLNHG